MFNGKRLRDLRKSNNMTQQELGTLVNVGKSTISQYENGINIPDIDTVTIFANFFCVSVDYLVGNSESKTSCENYIVITNDEGIRRIIPIPLDKRDRLLNLLYAGFPELLQPKTKQTR